MVGYLFRKVRAIQFTSCYLLFYLLILYLNILIKQLNQKQYMRLLGIVLLIYTMIPSVSKMSITFNYVSWFCIIYLVGMLVPAVFAFIWFKNLKIGYSRVINATAA
ncbi:MAG: hypothetical protein PUC55_10665 [Lachnospiraceae bacterium]|nr:hypothetical protein [Lachnospiraceae bacterium]